MLVVSGILMLTARYLPHRYLQVNWLRSLLIGCAQACAIMPGLSRSGSTIFAGMAVGIPREKSAAFSFLLSIPAILGAAVLQLGDLVNSPPGGDAGLALLGGTIGAAVSGYLAIKLLLGVIRKNQLHWFGMYCLAVAAIGFGHYFLIR
jgi:undecaprenyl-diphosphatase